MSQDVTLVSYNPDYQADFKSLNESWIKQYFVMEESDYKALDNPDDYIISSGGYIVMAIMDDTVVGTCALIKMADGGFELAKMAVSESAQGYGIGNIIGEHMINKARELGANRLWLESNTKLVPAINLYRKLGFSEVAIDSTGYDRVDIQMELAL